jgi:hypothetical protein
MTSNTSLSVNIPLTVFVLTTQIGTDDLNHQTSAHEGQALGGADIAYASNSAHDDDELDNTVSFNYNAKRDVESNSTNVLNDTLRPDSLTASPEDLDADIIIQASSEDKIMAPTAAIVQVQSQLKYINYQLQKHFERT